MRRSRTSTNSVASKGCSTAFFGVFALFGLLILGAVSVSLFHTMRTYFWEETPCTVIESRRYEPGEGSQDFIIRYRYRAADRLHTSARFNLGMKESLDSKKIEQLLARYPVGAEARCFADAGNPEQAVLQRGTLWIGLVLLFPLIFLAVGVGGIMNTWRPGYLTSFIKSRSASSGAMRKFAPLFFFGVFALVGGLFFYFVTVRSLLLYFDARSWPETPCEIVSSGVGSHTSTERSSGSRSSRTSTTYSIDIVYRYTVDRHEYRSERYEVMGGSSSGHAGKAAVVARYPAGLKTMCYVNPKNPTEALLDRGLSPFMLVGLIPGLFFLVGVSGIVGTLRSALKASGTVTLPGVPTLPAPPGASPAVAGGPILLKPSLSPIGKLIVTILLAAVWNGITGIFVAMGVKSWMEHSPDRFYSLFIIPFVLIGLVLIAACVGAFLNLFNPRVALVVSSQSVPLGGTLDVRWNFRGAVSRIRRLRIFLEGREEARYRRGTTTDTDKEVFAQLPIIETDDALRIPAGQTQFIIPERLMHTWDGGNNKIVWELKVRGEIPRYPDVVEEFAFTVLPKAR